MSTAFSWQSTAVDNGLIAVDFICAFVKSSCLSVLKPTKGARNNKNCYFNSMKKKECPSCAMMIDEKSKICPVCQYEFPGGMGTLHWTAIALVILFVVYRIASVF